MRAGTVHGSSATAVNHFDQLNGCNKLAVLKDVSQMFLAKYHRWQCCWIWLYWVALLHCSMNCLLNTRHKDLVRHTTGLLLSSGIPGWPDRQECLWIRLWLRCVYASWGWRLHLWRGNSFDRVYWGETREAPPQASFPCWCGSVWLPNNCCKCGNSGCSSCKLHIQYFSVCSLDTRCFHFTLSLCAHVYRDNCLWLYSQL